MAKPGADEILEAVERDEAEKVAARAAHRHRRTVADLRAENRELNATIDALEEDIATLEALRAKPGRLKPLPPAKRKRGGKLPAAFVALASDWHTCEIVTARQTGGRNVHNQEIGTERAWRWAKGLVRMCKDEQARADVKTLVVWLGGDFLVNDGLHYKSERATYLSPTEEARFIRDLLVQIIDYLRKELDVARIVFVTNWGNHDRDTLKMVPGHAGDYSHMQAVYRDLAAWFSADPRIEFRIAESEWHTVDVHGYGILFHHGHAVSYKRGAGGPGVNLMRMFPDLKSKYNFRTAVIGHYHQRGMYRSGQAFTNGSLVGENGFSEYWAMSAEAASQVAFLIDLERQEIANWYAIWGE